MKAGQNNFGITTHITTKAYPMGAVWGAVRVWNSSQIHAISEAFAEYQREGQLDTKSSVIPYLVPTNGTIFITLVYFAPVTTRPKAYAGWSSKLGWTKGSSIREVGLDEVRVEADMAGAL